MMYQGALLEPVEADERASQQYKAKNQLGRHQRGAFAASCVQRLARGFLDSPAVHVERPNDVQVAQGLLLSELWVPPPAAPLRGWVRWSAPSSKCRS